MSMQDSVWETVQRDLNAFAVESGLDSIVLANEDGLLIAACGTSPSAEMMAAVCPLSNTQRGAALHLFEDDLEDGAEISFLQVHHQGHSLFLCVTGSTAEHFQHDLQMLLNSIVHRLHASQEIDC